jgi:eukaryotic-like serine/threonine-protein kinase
MRTEVAVKPLGASDPRTLGKYKLRAELGRGGMGRVLLATGRHGELVAIKRVHEHLATDNEFKQRFRREVRASRKVTSRHTAPVVDAGPETGVPWLASEFVYGPSLREALDAVRSLPEEAVLRLAAGLAAALRDIHAAGLVHRDLTPSNVLLADDGPRVIDFGIVRAVEGLGTTRYGTRSGTRDLTHTGMAIGTPGYMSPEQAEGRQQITPASDVFSFGTMLLVACTGENPFEAPAGMLQTMYNVVHMTPDLSAVPGRVRRIIGPCLSKDPGERPTPARLLDMIGSVDSGGWPWPATVRRLTERQRAEVARLVPGSAAGTVRAPGPGRTRTLPNSGPGPRIPPSASQRPPDPKPNRGRIGVGILVALGALLLMSQVYAANTDDDASGSGSESYEPTDDYEEPTYPDDFGTTPTADEDYPEPDYEETYEDDPEPPPPSPTPDPVANAVEGDCFDNYGTRHDWDLEPTTCGDGTWEAVQIIRGSTDLDRCRGLPRVDWRVSYEDMVFCLSYQHGNGSAYHAQVGECVYGGSGGDTVWEIEDCQTGNFTVVGRYHNKSDWSDCDSGDWDHGRSFTVTGWGNQLNVRLCLLMNYPDDIGHADIDTCLSMTGTEPNLNFEFADCDYANVYVTGRTSTYDDTAFCGSDGWSTWQSYDFPDLSYTVCFRDI